MKTIVGIIIISIAILVGGVYFGSNAQVAGESTVDQTVLIRSKKHSINAEQEKVVLVEFADFQCPACGMAHPIVKEVLEKYKGKITFVYRHFPLQQHQNARLAAKASEAASAQGKFWEMYDILYSKQSEWSESENPGDLFRSYAKSLQLDNAAFEKSMQDSAIDELIQQDYADGSSLGVNSTPTFFLNGKKLSLYSLRDLAKAVDEELGSE